jgi:arylsulfatase A-like enzyme/Tfp pilus assembly protein PilF
MSGKTRSGKKIALALNLAALLALSGCSRRPNPDQNAADANIILITVDTLRADRLEPYGYGRVKTPWISRLAADGVLFHSAIAQVPLTLPSLCSILTGEYPATTGVRDNAGFVLQGEQTTLAEKLKAAGYETAAFVGSSVLKRGTGLAQGFDFYSDPEGGRRSVSGPEGVERRAEVVFREALQWIESPGRKKFFVWIHVFDPHAPYQPPEPHASAYRDNPYDGEIAYVDSAMGGMVQASISHGWYEKSLIVFTSDHGESLGEHGEQFHGFFLYDATLHVPLIVKLPRGQWSGRTVHDQARSVDIAPTILDLAALKPDASMQGESLRSRMAGNPGPALEAYSETYFPYYHFRWSPLKSVRSSQYKYISAPTAELYDLKADARELKNLASDERVVASKFAEQLSAKYPDLPAAPSTFREPESEAQERLRSLGYIGSPRVIANAAPNNLPDPKNKIAVYNLLQKGLEEATRGSIDQSIRTLQSVLRQDDQIIDAHLSLGVNYAEQRRFAEAARSFQSTLALDERNVPATFNLALCYGQLGKWDQAIVGFQRTLELNPNEIEARVALGRAYQIRGDFPQARHALERAIAEQPDLAEARRYLAEVYQSLGMKDKAAGEARGAGRLGPGS